MPRPRVSRTQTNAPSDTYWQAYARKRAPAVATKGGKHEMHGGYLMRFTRRRRRCIATLLDMPHTAAFLNVYFWPHNEFAPAYPQVIPVAATRDGLITGAGVKEYSDEDITPGLNKVQPSDFLTYSLGVPASFLTLAGVTYPAPGVENHGAGHVTSEFVEDVSFYPMPTGQLLGARVLFVGHWRRPIQFQFSEAYISSVTGGGSLVSRGHQLGTIDDTYKILSVFVPEPTADYKNGVVTSIIPATAGTNDPYDYGTKSLFYAEVTVPPDSPGAVASAATAQIPLPSAPQFEHGNWADTPQSSEYSGWMPSYVKGAVSSLVGGGVVYYGVFHSGVGVIPGGALGEESPDGLAFFTTLFRMVVTPEDTVFFDVIRCVASNDQLADRRVDSSVEDGNTFFEYPSSFSSETITWGAYLKVTSGQTGSFRGRMSFGLTDSGNTVTVGGGGVAGLDVAIVQDDQVIFESIPTGYRLFGPPPDQVTFFANTRNSVSFKPSLYACHLLDKDQFGVTFLVEDEALGKYRLAYWDSVSGFGIWPLDYSVLDERTPDFRFPALSCYRRQYIDDEGNPAGDVGMFLMLGDAPTPATYVITNNVVHYYAEAYAPAVFPTGNIFTRNGSTVGAYQVYNLPQEE